MSDLSYVDTKQLIKRHRHLTDKLEDLKEKLTPYFEEYDKLRTEYLEVDTELARRQGLPTIHDVTETSDD